MRRLALFLALTIFFAAIPHQILAQESNPETWSISEEPTVQKEVKEGEKILVDPLGYLWTRSVIILNRAGGTRVSDGIVSKPEFVPGPSQEYWTVYDSGGMKTTTLQLPWDVTLKTIGEDFILCGWNDESGKEFVRLYSLDRSDPWSVSDEPTVQMEVSEESKVLVDPLGYLWVKTPFLIFRGGIRSIGEEVYEQPRTRGAGRRVWTVFNSSGQEVTSRTRPSYVTIQTIGKDYIQAVWTGPNSGVEYFGTYSLDRSGSDAESWVISQQTTVQLEVKEGDKVLVDPLGYFWVCPKFQIYRGGSAVDLEGVPLGPPPDTSYVTWDVYDSTGRKVTTVTTSRYFTVQTIGEDFIQGIWKDVSGTGFARVYSLDRGG